MRVAGCLFACLLDCRCAYVIVCVVWLSCLFGCVCVWVAVFVCV